MIIDKNVRKETKDIIIIFRKANFLTYFYEVRISSDSLSNIVSRKGHYVKNIDKQKTKVKYWQNSIHIKRYFMTK